MKRLKIVFSLLLVIGIFSATYSIAKTPVSATTAYTTAMGFLESRGELYFKFQIESHAELSLITKLVSIDNVVGNTVYAYANKTEFARFLKIDIPYEVLTPPGLEKVAIKMMDAAAYSKASKNRLGKSAVPMLWDSYPTYDGYVAMMNTFAATYPTLCRIDSLGTSIQGRKILAAKISSNVTQDAKKAKFCYESTIHGDEVCGYVLMLRLIDYLLTNYPANARVKRLLDNLEIWIAPDMNPDGTYRGGNTSVSGAVRYNSNNVDLNRSFPSPAGASDAQQQPETVVYMNFSKKHHFTLSADFHGGAEVVCYVWGCWPRNHADVSWWTYVAKEWADTAKANSTGGYFTGTNTNGYINGYAWYVVNGERMNWEGYWNQCRDVTVELSVTKLLGATLLPSRWDYQYRSFLNYMEQALYGIRGTVTDSITGAPLRARIWVNSHDVDSSHVFAWLPHGDYYRLINAGTYSLTCVALDSATGRVDTVTYFPKTITNVVVVNKQATNLDIKLRRRIPIGINNRTINSSIAASLTVLPSGHGLLIKTNGSFDHLAIYGVNGKLVKMVPVCRMDFVWDGNDEAGNAVGRGLYFVKAWTGATMLSKSVVFMR